MRRLTTAVLWIFLSTSAQAQLPAPDADDIIGRVGLGPTGADIYFFERASNAAAGDPAKAFFFFTPPVFLKRLPGEDAAYVEVQNKPDARTATVRLFLIRPKANMRSEALRIARQRMGADVPFDNIIEIPFKKLKVTLANPADLPFPIEYVSTTDGALMAGSEDQKPISFRLPANRVEEFVDYIKHGLDLRIQFFYKSKRQSRNEFRATASIKVSTDLNRRFFGNRNSVYASEDQLAQLMMEAQTDMDFEAVAGSSGGAELISSILKEFIATVAGTKAKLGELSRGYVTAYGLDPQKDSLLQPDKTTHLSNQVAKTSENLQVLSNFMQEYSNKSGGGGVGVGFFAIGASVAKGKGSASGSNSVQSQVQSSAQSQEWDGETTAALNITMYEVTKLALNDFTKMHGQFTVMGDPYEVIGEVERNTVTHAIVMPH